MAGGGVQRANSNKTLCLAFGPLLHHFELRTVDSAAVVRVGRREHLRQRAAALGQLVRHAVELFAVDGAVAVLVHS